MKNQLYPQKTLWLLSLILAIALSACNLPTASTPEFSIEAQSETLAAQTVEASGQVPPPNAEIPTPLPTVNLPLATTEVPATPTIALSPTPSVPMVSVSVDTNCRTGPGKAYDQIGALMTSEKAEAVGKNTASNYWIIKNPDANGTCWLWGYYATIAGNTSNLQEYAVPPTPTPAQTPTPHPPSAPKNLTATDKSCTNFAMWVTLEWTDTSDNEDGFRLYIYGTTFSFVVLAANQTQTIVNLPYTANVPVEFLIASYNTADKSFAPGIQVTCP